MLDEKVTAYLRQHPAVLAELVERLLGGEHMAAAANAQAGFGGRTRKIVIWPSNVSSLYDDVGLPIEARAATEHVENTRRDFVPSPDGVLVPDLYYHIVDQLVTDALTDDRVLLDIILFALVCLDLNAYTRWAFARSECLINVVPLYGRAMFDYYTDMSTFALFRARLERFAPATAFAWTYMLNNADVKARLDRLVPYMKRELPRHYELALECDGLDPIATVLGLHLMAPASVRLPQVVFQDLYDRCFDKEWVCTLWQPADFEDWPVDPVATIHDGARYFKTVATRAMLDDVPVLERLELVSEDWDVRWQNFQLPFRELKGVWKHIVHTETDKALFKCFKWASLYLPTEHTAKVVSYYLARHCPPTGAYLTHKRMRELLKPLQQHAGPVAAMMGVALYFTKPPWTCLQAMPITAFMAWRLTVDFRPLWIDDLCDLLIGALRHGRADFVDDWIREAWPFILTERVADPVAFVASIQKVSKFLGQPSFVKKRDPSGAIQWRLCALFAESNPMNDWTALLTGVVCVSDKLLANARLNDVLEGVGMCPTLKHRNALWHAVVGNGTIGETLQRLGMDAEASLITMLQAYILLTLALDLHMPVRTLRGLFDYLSTRVLVPYDGAVDDLDMPVGNDNGLDIAIEWVRKNMASNPAQSDLWDSLSGLVYNGELPLPGEAFWKFLDSPLGQATERQNIIRMLNDVMPHATNPLVVFRKVLSLVDPDNLGDYLETLEHSEWLFGEEDVPARRRLQFVNIFMFFVRSPPFAQYTRDEDIDSSYNDPFEWLLREREVPALVNLLLVSDAYYRERKS